MGPDKSSSGIAFGVHLHNFNDDVGSVLQLDGSLSLYQDEDIPELACSDLGDLKDVALSDDTISYNVIFTCKDKTELILEDAIQPQSFKNIFL